MEITCQKQDLFCVSGRYASRTDEDQSSREWVVEEAGRARCPEHGVEPVRQGPARRHRVAGQGAGDGRRAAQQDLAERPLLVGALQLQNNVQGWTTARAARAAVAFEAGSSSNGSSC